MAKITTRVETASGIGHGTGQGRRRWRPALLGTAVLGAAVAVAGGTLDPGHLARLAGARAAASGPAVSGVPTITPATTLAVSGAVPATPPAAVEPPPLLAALKLELARSMSRLRLRGYEAPYFISYTLRETESHDVIGKLGAVFGQSSERSRVIHVEVRVGSYEFDNTSADGSDGNADLALSLSEVSKDAPLDDNLEALRGALWLITDQKYKAALAAYASKRARGVRDVESEDKLPSFSKEAVQRLILPPPAFPVELPAMVASVRQLGERLKQAPVFDGEVKLSADRMSRYYVSSEGAEVVEHRTIYGAHLVAQARAKDGMLLTNERDYFARSPAQLPAQAELLRAMDGLAGDIKQLVAAPAVDPYTGPAILMEEAAGVFFHETIGHRLEGERQLSEQEGRTFKGQIGQRVLPEFLSVIDDPTLAMSPGPAGIPLNGFYRIDDEGVPARAVALIDKGVLRDYLKSRTPVLGSLRSNGHARAEGTNDPTGRMANLVIRASRSVSLPELKAQLLAEVRRQGKPYGLIIRDILGGSTNTAFGSQTFRGQPTMVYRVDAKTGEESLVRGVEMVGTPLSSVAKIVAASDTIGVFNGYCGAESGLVPVSTVAPAVLFTEIELQRAQHASERPPILPPPWRDNEPAAPAKGHAGKKN